MSVILSSNSGHFEKAEKKNNGGLHVKNVLQANFSTESPWGQILMVPVGGLGEGKQEANLSTGSKI